jgi:hypothetical protein
MSTRMPIVLTRSMQTLVGTRTRWFSLITALAISWLVASLSARQRAEQTTPTMPVHARFEDGAGIPLVEQESARFGDSGSMEGLSAWSFARRRGR